MVTKLEKYIKQEKIIKIRLDLLVFMNWNKMWFVLEQSQAMNMMSNL